MVFGSHLVERSLVVYCQAAKAHYHTTEVCLTHFSLAREELGDYSSLSFRPAMHMMS